jgi:hypothetical protein
MLASHHICKKSAEAFSAHATRSLTTNETYMIAPMLFEIVIVNKFDLQTRLGIYGSAYHDQYCADVSRLEKSPPGAASGSTPPK